jgi:hypothetical protein
MPTPKQHQQKADDNRAFLNAILSTGPPEWVATVAFYTAVHLVEKLLAYSGNHSKNHEERGSAVRKDFRQIYSQYHELFNNSLIARYGTSGKFSMTLDKTKQLLVNDYLAKIEKFVAEYTIKMSTPPPSKN